MGRAANVARLRKNRETREKERAKAKALVPQNGESKTVASERKEDMNLDKGVHADVKAPTVETKYLSDKTKQEIDKMADNRVNSTINQAKAAPGIAYGIVDIAGGEKVTGVISIVKSAPAFVKGRVQNVKAHANLAKSAKSLSDDMKGLDSKEKAEALAEYAKYTASSGVETIKGKPKEVKEDVNKAVNAISDIANKDKSSKHDERLKTAERRLNIESLNQKQIESGMEY